MKLVNLAAVSGGILILAACTLQFESTPALATGYTTDFGVCSAYEQLPFVARIHNIRPVPITLKGAKFGCSDTKSNEVTIPPFSYYIFSTYLTASPGVSNDLKTDVVIDISIAGKRRPLVISCRYRTDETR